MYWGEADGEPAPVTQLVSVRFQREAPSLLNGSASRTENGFSELPGIQRQKQIYDQRK